MKLISKTLALIIAGAIALFAGASPGGMTNQAKAFDPHCEYITVTVWVVKQIPVVKWVTKYDHCGDAYLAKVVTYKTVKVPVEKRVLVCE